MLRLLALAPPLLVALSAVLASYVGSISLTLFGWALALGSLLLLSALARYRCPDQHGTDFRTWWHLVAATTCAFALHGFALLQSKLPLGIDAAFHCTVALHFAQQGRVTNHLRPLEDLDLNYPTASHGLLALLSRTVSRDPSLASPHTIFRWLFLAPIIGAGLLAAAVAQQRAGPAAAPAALWAGMFGMFQATWFPYTWGGLPSVLAMWLIATGFFASVWIRRPVGTLAALLLWSGAVLTHHHAGAALLLALGLLAALRAVRAAWVGLSSPSGPSPMVLLLAVTACSAVYWIRLLGHAGLVSQTGLAEYVEPLESPWQLAWHMGPVACVGFLTVAVDWFRGRLTDRERLAIAFGLIWVAAFVALAYVGRAVASVWFGRPVSFFTPSRFLFEFQWALLPVVAASIGLRARQGTWLVAIGCVACVVSWTWPRWTNEPLSRLPVRLAHRQLTPPTGTVVADDYLLAPGQYVAEKAPLRAVVVSLPGRVWLTYCTRRESTGLFIPISEPVTDRIRLKHRLARNPTDLPWSEWSRRLGNLPLWGIYPRSWQLPSARVRARFGSVDVLELTPAGTSPSDR